MRIKIYRDATELALAAANVMVDTIRKKPDAVFCLATGDTPRVTYSEFVNLVKQEKIDISRVTFLGLDEWVGVPHDNPGGCHHFLHHYIFTPLALRPDQYHLFDGMSNDLAGECKKMDDMVAAKGGIDFMLVGIGLNAHIGFNEPGTSPDLYAHVAPLDELTQTIGQKYFTGQMELKYGITMGFKHVMATRMVMVMANGEKKAPIIKATLEGEISPQVPATIIRNHPNGWFYVDELAVGN